MRDKFNLSQNIYSEIWEKMDCFRCINFDTDFRNLEIAKVSFHIPDSQIKHYHTNSEWRTQFHLSRKNRTSLGIWHSWSVARSPVTVLMSCFFSLSICSTAVFFLFPFLFGLSFLRSLAIFLRSSPFGLFGSYVSTRELLWNNNYRQFNLEDHLEILDNAKYFLWTNFFR